MKFGKLFVIAVAGIMLTSALGAVSGNDLASRGTPDDADSEPNDSIADATNITQPSITIPGTLESGDNSDVYKIWLANNGATADSMSITADFNRTTGVSIEVLDSDGFQYYIGFDSNADNVNLNYVSGYSQFYYINVSTQMVDATYDLTVVVSNNNYNGNSNNHPSQAPTVQGDNTPRSQSLDGDTPEDHQDFYKISLSSSASAADLLVVYMEQPAGAVYQLELYREEGGGQYTNVKSKASTPGSDVVMSYGTENTADYYLRVFAFSGSGQYTVYMQKTEIAKDNDNSYDQSSEISLTNDHTWTHQGEVGETIDGEDWYKIEIVEGQFINITIDSLDYDASTELPQIYLSLFRSDHTFEYSDPNQTDSQVDPIGYTNGTTPDDSGYNYIKVHVVGGGGGGRYDLDLLTDKPPALVNDFGGTINVKENEVNASLDLDNVFNDPDASDTITYTYEKLSGTAGWEDDSNLSIDINGEGVVTVTPKAGSPSGWTGSGTVVFTATDPFDLNTTAEFLIDVKGVNHKPYVMGPYNESYSFPEPVLLTYGENENNGTINLKDVFADNDTGDKLKFEIYTDDPLWINKDYTTFMGEKVLNAAIINDSIRIGFVKESNLIDQKGPINIYITDDAKNSKQDHDADIYFQAIDNGAPSMTSEQVRLHIMIRSPGGNPPEWKGTLSKVIFEEDNSTVVDFDEHTIDVDPADDGALQYEVSNYGDNITVEKLTRNTFEFSAEENWNGQVDDIKVMVTDTFGLTANKTFSVEVRAVHDGPVEVDGETSPDPATTVQVSEGAEKNFTVGAMDPDGEDVQMVFEWYLDDELLPTQITDTFVYAPDHDAAGTHVIKVRVIDDVKPELEFNVTWTVQVQDVNRDPTGVEIISPEHNETYKQGSKIEFRAKKANDPDGDVLSYTWLADGSALPDGSNRTFEYKKLKPGEHTITLEVTDGNGGKATDEVTIKIKKKKEDSPGFGGVALLMALAVLGLIALRKRR